MRVTAYAWLMCTGKVLTVVLSLLENSVGGVFDDVAVLSITRKD
jgi:hypothetical protein